jgi:hypothetical protein
MLRDGRGDATVRRGRVEADVAHAVVRGDA